MLGGSEFNNLLIALCFHQFFEGFALGTAVVAVAPSRSMVINTVAAYVVSTPIGVAIGVLIRSSYNGNSVQALWTQGVFDAVSAGTLIYAGLVELLTYGLTIHPKYGIGAAKKTTLASAFLGMYVGAGTMSLVGKWA